jgi:hypothetical protein
LGVTQGVSVFQILPQGSLLDVPAHLVIKQFAMPAVNPGRLDRHRAVEKDRERLHLFPSEHHAQQDDQQLGSTHRKRRNQDRAAHRRRGLDDLHKLFDRVAKRTMVAVAVGGFQEHHESAGQSRQRVADERAAQERNSEPS